MWANEILTKDESPSNDAAPFSQKTRICGRLSGDGLKAMKKRFNRLLKLQIKIQRQKPNVTSSAGAPTYNKGRRD